jgi:hypothetical protein
MVFNAKIRINLAGQKFDINGVLISFRKTFYEEHTNPLESDLDMNDSSDLSLVDDFEQEGNGLTELKRRACTLGDLDEHTMRIECWPERL